MATIDLGLVKGDTGPQGPQGIPGDAGPQGLTGATGPAGADGVTPNVQAGATTTLPAGSDATVTRRAGSPDEAPIFDFSIPQGLKGDPGDPGPQGPQGDSSVPVVTTTGTGSAYAIEVPEITGLEAGTMLTIIPHTASTATTPTLNLNNTGAKTIKRLSSGNTNANYPGLAASWLAAGKPVQLQYTGSVWIATGLTKPNASDMVGTVPTANGGTGNGDGYIRTGQQYGVSASYATAEGTYTEANGVASHAEGTLAKAQGSYSHAEGNETVASGQASHAEGGFVTAAGDYSHAEGYRSTADKCIAYGRGSHIEGIDTVAGTSDTENNTDFAAHAEGIKTVASGSASHAEGKENTASGQASHAEGNLTEASGTYSHTEGYMNTASGYYAHAEGRNTSAAGQASHAGGCYTKTPSNGFAMTVIGKYNVGNAGCASASAATGTLFEIGKGTSDTARSNAFRADATGTVYGNGAYNSSGADYAEMFEWLDGNPDGEDRRGLFVTLDGEKIRIAGPDDAYILGVVSADPAILGDSYFGDNWHGMYLRDVFGQLLIETVHVEETVDEVTGKTLPAHDEERHVLNPDWDHEQSYIAREDRTEWAPVGMLGKLVVIDDGSCTVNGYCRAGANGAATAAESGYRVLARIDQTHIRALIR